MVICLIILVNILLYNRTIQYSGICDDIPVFNQPFPMPKSWWRYFWLHLHGRKYWSYKLGHCQALGIHTINCVLIYLAFGHSLTSAVAALLFAVNPVNNQCSIWISGKGYSMNLTCALLMWMLPLASPLTYVYGLYFQGPSLLLFPLVFLFTKYWWLSSLVLLGLWREHTRIFDKKNPGSKFNTESNSELRAIAPRKLIIMFKSLGYYFINSISAMRLGFYHKYLFLHGVNKDTNKDSYKIDKYFFIGIGVALLTVVTLNQGLVNQGLIWFCVCIIMWCNFISFNQTITNRYIYLPNAGLMLVLSSLLMIYPPLALIALTYYITKLCLFLYFYKNEYWSIEYSCIEQPDFFYPFQNRSVHCFQNGNYQGALGNMIKANDLRPNDWKISYNICQLYMLLGNINASKDWFAKAKLCNIDGREVAIGNLMTRLETWITEVEAQAKANGNAINLDIGKFDMQR